MVTDKIINVFYGMVSAFFDLLPGVGGAPSWVNSGSGLLAAADVVIPLSGVATLLSWMVGIFTLLYLWRAIRMITPGG